MTKFILLFILFVTSMSARAGLPPTSTKGNGDTGYTTTFKFDFPNISVSRSGTTTTFNTVNVAGGGTGVTSLTANNVVLGNGTAPVQLVAPGTSGNFLVSNGTSWISSTLSNSTIVTSVGAVSPDIQSVYFGAGADCTSFCTAGTCTICNRVGTKITSIAWAATGGYELNGIDGTKYNCTGGGYGSSAKPTVVLQNRALSTSTRTRVNFHGVTTADSLENSSYASVTCIGVP
jgi:hypothetical protein